MASKEGMLFKFFEKWKQKRLNKLAKKVLKDNPSLQKDLEKLDKVMVGPSNDIPIKEVYG